MENPEPPDIENKPPPPSFNPKPSETQLILLIDEELYQIRDKVDIMDRITSRDMKPYRLQHILTLLESVSYILNQFNKMR